MEPIIGSKFTFNLAASDNWGKLTLVHVFPKDEKPDETLARVFYAGPAGEPPPQYVYSQMIFDRWVFKKEIGRGFVVVRIPNKFLTPVPLDDNP